MFCPFCGVRLIGETSEKPKCAICGFTVVENEFVEEDGKLCKRIKGVILIITPKKKEG